MDNYGHPDNRLGGAGRNGPGRGNPSNIRKRSLILPEKGGSSTTGRGGAHQEVKEGEKIGRGGGGGGGGGACKRGEASRSRYCFIAFPIKKVQRS